MTLRCKQGDLAVIVRARVSENIGKIVKCVSRYDGPWVGTLYEPGWNIDIQITNSDGLKQSQIADKNLRPLRNDTGQDETLTWKDVPSTSEVTA